MLQVYQRCEPKLKWGTHIEKENDKIRRMEHDYGRIATEIEYDAQN